MAAVVALTLFLVWGGAQQTPVSVADGGHDTHVKQQEQALHQKQSPGLDQQADTGDRPDLTDPDHHVGEEDLPSFSDPGSDARAAGSVTAQLPMAKGGRWTFGTELPKGFYAIHAVVMPGKILVIAGSGNSTSSFAAGSFRSLICDTKLQNCKQVTTPGDLFCSGHVLLPDGRVLVGGGTQAYGAWKGAKYLWAFNPKRNAYEQLKPMEVGRWYPTLINVSGGQTLITGGIDENGEFTASAEMFNYKDNTHRLITKYALGVKDGKLPPYGRQVLTDDPNTVFFSGVAWGGYTGLVSPMFWNFRTGKTRPVSGLRAPTQRDGAANCFYGDAKDGRLMVMGGGPTTNNLVDIIDLDSSNPRFRAAPGLRAKKQYLSCITLPNGWVFEANGGAANKIAGASYEASVFKKFGGAPTALNPLPSGNHRQYHSNLLFLDDGRIVSFGSNPNREARSVSLLYFSPPEIKGKRPKLTKIPSTVTRGKTIKVKAKDGNKLVFRAPDSSTHGMNAGGFIQTLSIKTKGKVKLSLSKAQMPPGYYQVFVVSTKGKTKGKYSTAKWVRVLG
ncbi:MAG: DUF1929 domain-containing protein [Microlunatus sp.]